jgi:hypothetical protein
MLMAQYLIKIFFRSLLASNEREIAPKSYKGIAEIQPQPVSEFVVNGFL